MATTIDLDKVKTAYDYLAETEGGHSALGEFNGALARLQGSVEGDLNRGEFLYLLRGLVNDLNVEEPAEVSGYAMRNPDQLSGLLFQESPTGVTRLGTGIESPAFNRVAQGFNVRLQL